MARGITGVLARRIRSVAALLVILIDVATCTPAISTGPAAEPPVLGERPSYGPPAVSDLPNGGAVQRRIWVPGLDDGFDPQGLAVTADGSLLVSGYRSDSLHRSRGPCAVFRVDPATGRTTGRLDVPPPCGHAGGIATAANGTIYLADTHTLFEIPLANAFAAPPPPMRRFPLGPGLVGALAASGGADIWIGTYRPDGPGRIFRFATRTLDRLADGATLRAEDAAASLPLPSYSQGAAVDPSGRVLWVARSDFDWATLDALDLASGALLHRFAAPGGMEGLAYAADGTLWAVCESGARHIYDIPLAGLVSPFNPLILAIAPGRLQTE
jgi:sugar lactone lactonase YvrE